MLSDLRASLEKTLGPIRSLTPVSGGDINAAAQIETGDARYFVKWNTAPLPRMFEAEARGLKLLDSANALRIPHVVALIDQPPALILEWIDLGANKQAASEALGRGLAQQHRSSAPTYGLDHDNTIGSNPQCNTPTRSWIEFYRDRRLAVQRDLARQRGQLTAFPHQ